MSITGETGVFYDLEKYHPSNYIEERTFVKNS